MNKYFIKIKRNTIKKNPDAGRTSIMVPGMRDIELLMSLPMSEKNLNRLYDKHCIKPSSGWMRVAYILLELNRKLEKSIKKNNENMILKALNKLKDKCALISVDLNRPTKAPIQLIINNNLQQFNTIVPEPNYLYKYKDIKVQCEYCNKRFSYKKLESEETYDGGLMTNICPYCGEPQCCGEIEYEKFGGIIK